ncbi:Kinesin_motor domain [Hexamita inflata]|uniref:Kinesin motor domain n=1 Tax=Hexamita inflata TaxID=28002 RepID=A0AA86Q2K3_9EUKA|nr:Kinesin motor domain [Hexamita inflata]
MAHLTVTLSSVQYIQRVRSIDGIYGVMSSLLWRTVFVVEIFLLTTAFGCDWGSMNYFNAYRYIFVIFFILSQQKLVVNTIHVGYFTGLIIK